MGEKFYSISPYTFAINNSIEFIDPDGMEVQETENGTIYNGEDMIKKMAEFGIITKQDNNDLPEEPIDLFGSHDKPNSSFHTTARNFEWEEGDRKLFVMAHASMKGIASYDEKGKQTWFSNSKEFNDFLKQKTDCPLQENFLKLVLTSLLLRLTDIVYIRNQKREELLDLLTTKEMEVL